MKSLNLIFLRLCIYLIAGILISFHLQIDSGLLWAFNLGVILFFLYSFFRARKQLFTGFLPGISSFLIIFTIGLNTGTYSQPRYKTDHIIHYPANQLAEEHLLIAEVVEELKPNSFSKRYIIKAKSLESGKSNSQNISGKLLLNLKNDSLNKLNLKPGNSILIPYRTKDIPKALIPFQFNYRAYLKTLKTEVQLDLNSNELLLMENENVDLKTNAWRTRENLIARLGEKNFSKDELAVYQALILGQRRDISDELYKTYAASGAIHILAISGLHIGIILLFLNFLFKPLEQIKYGKLLKPILIIMCLWGFAVISGLSPSVVRAVCMFSFLAVGMQLKKKTSNLNSLFLSLFFLVLINPYYLFQVGFQLSYLAVISIIIFQPIIYGLIITRLKVIDYLWKIASVSIAAQIGVLPLSLFYFHQFPGLFLLTNIIIIPFLGILLGLGFLVIFLAAIDLLPDSLASLFGNLLDLMNNLIARIAGFKSFIIEGINISLSHTIAVYFLIISLVYLLHRINFISLSLLLSSVLFLQISHIYSRADMPMYEGIIFHKSRESVVGIRHRQSLKVYAPSGLNSAFLKDYKRNQNIDSINYQALPEVFQIDGKMVYVPQDNVPDLTDFNPDIILLTNSTRINLNRLIKTIEPNLIIADGSNYPSVISKWKETCDKQKIPFHHTGEKGAYIFNSQKTNWKMFL
ncbi:ComEC/Rec2 family competence protein [Christiangramia salexigens]|uniref:Competence protein n=1 Tax=Christiangramia salexigens TaxID=1913577 RepID=A0A1L3J7I4_9FLAO|nr:ComEC/Rec2 family competence protein [Christiangramia salexigens]APG61063.1 hypothetical protein LPB144_11880 [Christiangramia salexigens]